MYLQMVEIIAIEIFFSFATSLSTWDRIARRSLISSKDLSGSFCLIKSTACFSKSFIAATLFFSSVWLFRRGVKVAAQNSDGLPEHLAAHLISVGNTDLFVDAAWRVNEINSKHQVDLTLLSKFSTDFWSSAFWIEEKSIGARSLNLPTLIVFFLAIVLLVNRLVLVLLNL